MSCLARFDVDSHNAQHFAGGAAFRGVLDQRGLHDADQRLAVRRNGESFHSFVRGAPTRVVCDLRRAPRSQVGDEQVFGKSERPDSLPA